MYGLLPVTMCQVWLPTEAETMEGLIEKLKIMVPELLEANVQMIDYKVPFEIMTKRFETVQRIGLVNNAIDN